MIIKDFLAQFEKLYVDSETFVQVKAGFYGDSIFSNVKFFAQESWCNEKNVNEGGIELSFDVKNNNYSNKLLKVIEIINTLKKINCNWEITRFTIDSEWESNLPCPYFDLFLGSNSEIKVKIINSNLIELYLKV